MDNIRPEDVEKMVKRELRTVIRRTRVVYGILGGILFLCSAVLLFCLCAWGWLVLAASGLVALCGFSRVAHVHRILLAYDALENFTKKEENVYDVTF